MKITGLHLHYWEVFVGGMGEGGRMEKCDVRVRA